jgi:hypothetical protein
MDIDRKLLSRAAALLSEARDAIDRVRLKIDLDQADEETIDKLVIAVNDIDRLISIVDKLTAED